MRNYIQNNVIKIVANLKANPPFLREPLKITKRTHFPVNQIHIYGYMK